MKYLCLIYDEEKKLEKMSKEEGDKFMGDYFAFTDGIDFVVVTYLSPDGARLVAPAPLAIGSEVALTLPLLEPLDVRIVWVSNRLAGCRFLDPLHPAVLRVLAAAAGTERAAFTEN